jgi:hypothetical protein
MKAGSGPRSSYNDQVSLQAGDRHESYASTHPPSKGAKVIILGLILLIIGYVAGISLLYYIGGILLIVGVVLLVLGRTGRAVGGRPHWY